MLYIIHSINIIELISNYNVEFLKQPNQYNMVGNLNLVSIVRIM